MASRIVMIGNLHNDIKIAGLICGSDGDADYRLMVGAVAIALTPIRHAWVAGRQGVGIKHCCPLPDILPLDPKAPSTHERVSFNGNRKPAEVVIIVGTETVSDRQLCDHSSRIRRSRNVRNWVASAASVLPGTGLSPPRHGEGDRAAVEGLAQGSSARATLPNAHRRAPPSRLRRATSPCRGGTRAPPIHSGPTPSLPLPFREGALSLCSWIPDRRPSEGAIRSARPRFICPRPRRGNRNTNEEEGGQRGRHGGVRNVDPMKDRPDR